MVDTSQFQMPGLGPAPPDGSWASQPPQGAPTQQQGQMPAWMQQYIQMYGGGGYQMTPDDIAALSYAQMMGAAQQQFGQQQYNNDYLHNYLEPSLGLNALQIQGQQQNQQFQNGPYFDFMSGPYFDYIKNKNANDMGMSNNDLGISNNNLGISGNQLLVSGEDVKKARDYALAQNQALQQQQYQTAAVIAAAGASRFGY